jgi:hypothetical protein
LFHDMMNWKANKQHTITINFIEVKLLVLSITEKKWIWWMRFFKAIHFDWDHLFFIQCENMQVIKILITNRLIIKFRHVNIHQHWMRQKIIKRKIRIEWMFIIKIFVDELIKFLFRQRFEKFIHLLYMIKKFENKKNSFRLKNDEIIQKWSSSRKCVTINKKCNLLLYFY